MTDLIKEDIFGLTAEQLQILAKDASLPAFRGQQLAKWLYHKNVWDFMAMSDISRKDAAVFKNRYSVLPAKMSVLADQWSKDATTNKLLVRLPDGNNIETVGMQHNYGYSVCVSSQAGCAMNCAFCASTENGCIRNLTAAEMLAQVALFQKERNKANSRVAHVIIMGAGEPFLNYSEALKFIRLLHCPEIYNIGYRNITVSTCGIIDGIDRLARENIPVNLAISLHAPLDSLRTELMPVNARYNISALLSAAENYARSSGRQVTYEYILIKNVNDSLDMASKLARLLRGRLAAVNLIPFNSIAGKKYEKTSLKNTDAFCARLNASGIAATVRREMGADIMAACGQLKASFN